jgi:hypothetical protein
MLRHAAYHMLHNMYYQQNLQAGLTRVPERCLCTSHSISFDCCLNKC